MTKRWLVSLVLGVAMIATAVTQRSVAAMEDPHADTNTDAAGRLINPPPGLHVFSAGHSFHIWVAEILNDLATQGGIDGHVIVGQSPIGGSRVIEHWDVPAEKNLARKALREGQTDVLTLSPIWLPDEGIEKFAQLGVEHNPNIRITVQQYWMPNDTYEPVYPLDTGKKVDHNATQMDALRKHQAQYDHDIEEYVRGINERLGKDAIVIVPVGQATIALREKIIAGQAPGLAAQWDLFEDDWGHPTPPLKVLSAYCHFAVIYHRSPVGLPVPELLKQADKPQWQDPRLNRLLQELAWDVVRTHPMSGVK